MTGICTIHVDIDPAAERVVRFKDLFTKFWMRGDQRLRTAMAGLTRQVTTATERVARTKQLLEAADKDLPVRNDLFTKATAAVAAATTDVQQKTTAAMQASDAKTTAERESIAASAAARAMQLAKAKTDQAVKEVGVELQVAQQREHAPGAARQRGQQGGGRRAAALPRGARRAAAGRAIRAAALQRCNHRRAARRAQGVVQVVKEVV